MAEIAKKLSRNQTNEVIRCDSQVPGSRLPRSKYCPWEPTPKVKILSLGADSQGLRSPFFTPVCTGWNPPVEESLRKTFFCEKNQNENYMLILCKDSLCRRIRKWVSSAKISIVKDIAFWYTGSNSSAWIYLFIVTKNNHIMIFQFGLITIQLLKSYSDKRVTVWTTVPGS